MALSVYKETVCEATRAEIEIFLREHPEKTLPYHDCIAAWKLAAKASIEMSESISGFQTEFNATLEEYRNIFQSGDFVAIEALKCKISAEISDVCSRLQVDGHTRTLLFDLWGKTYESIDNFLD